MNLSDEEPMKGKIKPQKVGDSGAKSDYILCFSLVREAVEGYKERTPDGSFLGSTRCTGVYRYIRGTPL